MGAINQKKAPEPMPVRCASCRKTIAWTDTVQSLRNKMYCSHWCLEEPQATPTEERTDQWRMLFNAGFSPVSIGKIYDVAHSQVYIALKK